MDLRQLQYADAVARWANFTRAAGALHVAQPALSSAIRRLEAELGLRLFERTSRRVTVTDAGIAFVAHARRILDEVETLSDEMAQFAGALRGHVRMSVWYHLDPDLQAMLREFIRQNPNIELTIAEMPTPEALDGLRRGDLDLAVLLLVPGNNLAQGEAVEYMIVRTEPHMLAIALDHPLASATSVTLSELAPFPMIVSLPGTAMRSYIDQEFARAGVRPHIAVETNEMAASVAYAAIGIGAVILPRRIIEAVGPPTAIVPIVGLPPFVMALAWSRARYRGSAAALTLAYARWALDPDRRQESTVDR